MDAFKGRGVRTNPVPRFERLRYELPLAQGDDGRGDDADDVLGGDAARPATELFRDQSRSIITYNDSPDIGFGASVNPYRGCEHGCAYCYARPNHEFLGWSAGLDFETRILVKENAPELLRRELSSRKWQPQTLMLSGVTDCYQPIERRLGITRRCLEVLAEARNPVSIVTKNQLVARDIDLLAELAGFRAASVAISVTTLEAEVQQRLEPRASAPHARLDAIRALSQAGIPTGVFVAPIVPGLNDHELSAILDAAQAAGALFAGYVMLRLPFGVKDLFEDWLDRHYPQKKEKVLSRVRHVRSGKLNSSRFGERMSGEGLFADMIRDVFQLKCKKLGLTKAPRLSTAAFRPPIEAPLFAGMGEEG